jgi:uncharacterized glyoxalase superfamily protein PhnB
MTERTSAPNAVITLRLAKKEPRMFALTTQTSHNTAQTQLIEAADERPGVTEMMAMGTYASINLATTDVDRTFERLQARGAGVVQEPIEQPYGIRDCAFRDPAAT